MPMPKEVDQKLGYEKEEPGLPDVIPPNLRIDNNPFGSAQKKKHFTYRTNTDYYNDDASVFNINLFPDGYKKINKDIGLSQLLAKTGAQYEDVMVDDILNNVPRIIISEYIQDTKNDLVWSVFKYAVQGFDAAMEKVEKSGDAKTKGVWRKQAHAVSYMLRQKKFWNDIIEAASVDESFLPKFFKDKKHVLDFVFNFYYRMMRKTPINRYEFPNIDDTIFNTDGSSGWPNGSQWGNMKSSGNSTIGKLINYLGGSIRIISEPVWQGNTGSSNQQITLKCDLFNDTASAAVDNFMLIHSLFPNNMFMQYMFFQQPPCVYDVKIDGGPRLFMCSGSFKCIQKGINRTPSSQFREKLKTYSMIDTEYLNNIEMLKIPDVYSIELTFKSLLPDSFNEYMFRYAMPPYLIENEFAKDNFAVSSSGEIVKKARSVLEDEYKSVDIDAENWESAVEKLVNEKL